MCVLPNQHLCNKHVTKAIVVWCRKVMTIRSLFGKIASFTKTCSIITMQPKIKILRTNCLRNVWRSTVIKELLVWGIRSSFKLLFFTMKRKK